MTGMAAVLLYNVVEMTKKYISHPIGVKFSVEHQQQLTFPTVAICNMSPIKKSSLVAAQNIKRRKKRSAGKYRVDSCDITSVRMLFFCRILATVSVFVLCCH